MPGRVAYEFGGYRFEPDNVRLVRGDAIVPLTAKAADILLALVQHPNVLVSKDALMSAGWPDTAVEENNLNQQISALRKALSHDGAPIEIETVPRRGYRLAVPVRRIEVGEPTIEGRHDEAVPGVAAAPAVAEARPNVVPGRPWLLAAIASAAVLGLVVALGFSLGWFSRGAGESPESAQAIAKRRSLEAMERGSALHKSGNSKGAIDELHEAIQLDPENATAYGILAHALNAASGESSTSAVRPAGQSPSVEAAARGAAIAPDCASCRGTYGLFLFYHDWRFADAERQFKEAVRLGPAEAGIRPAYAMLLAVTGRHEEAVKQVDVGLAREPYHLNWLAIRASALYFGKRYEDVIATTDRALSIANRDRNAWIWRSKALFQLGRGKEALHALAQDLFASQSAELDRVVKNGGIDAGFRKVLELTDDWRGRIERAWLRAGWRAMLKDTDGALDELERAIEMRRPNAINFGADPMYDSIRQHPRFRKMLASIGLDSYFAK